MTNSVCIIKYSTGRSASAIFGFTPLFNNVSCDARFSYSHAPEQNNTRIFGNLISLIKSGKESNIDANLSASSKGYYTYKYSSWSWLNKTMKNLYFKDWCIYLNRPFDSVDYFPSTSKHLSETDNELEIKTSYKWLSREDRTVHKNNLYKFLKDEVNYITYNDYYFNLYKPTEMISYSLAWKFLSTHDSIVKTNKTCSNLYRQDSNLYTVNNVYIKSKYKNKVSTNSTKIDLSNRSMIVDIISTEKRMQSNSNKANAHDNYQYLSHDTRSIYNYSNLKWLQDLDNKVNEKTDIRFLQVRYTDICNDYYHKLFQRKYTGVNKVDMFKNLQGSNYDINNYENSLWFDVLNKDLNMEEDLFMNLYKDFSSVNIRYEYIFSSKKFTSIKINETERFIHGYIKRILTNEYHKSLKFEDKGLHLYDLTFSLKSSLKYLLYDDFSMFVNKNKTEAFMYDNVGNLQRSTSNIDYSKDDILLFKNKSTIYKQEELITANNIDIRKVFKYELGRFAYAKPKLLNVYEFNNSIIKNSTGLFVPIENTFVFKNNTNLYIQDMYKFVNKGSNYLLKNDYCISLDKTNYYIQKFYTDKLIEKGYKNKAYINANILLDNKKFNLVLDNDNIFLSGSNAYLDINSSMLASNGISKVMVDAENILLDYANPSVKFFDSNFSIDKAISNKTTILDNIQLSSGISRLYIGNGSYFLDKSENNLNNIGSSDYFLYKDKINLHDTDSSHCLLSKDKDYLYDIDSDYKFLSKDDSSLNKIDNWIFANTSNYKIVYNGFTTMLSKDMSNLQIESDYIFLDKNMTRLYAINTNKFLNKTLAGLFIPNTYTFLEKNMSNLWYENTIISIKKDKSYLSLDNKYMFASIKEKPLQGIQSNVTWLAKDEPLVYKDSQVYKWLNYSNKSVGIFNNKSASNSKDNMSIENTDIFGYNYNKELDLENSKIISISKDGHSFYTYDSNLGLSSGGKDIHIDSSNMSGFSKDFLPPIEILKGAIDELLLPREEYDYSDYKNNLFGENLTVNRKYLKKVNEDGNPIINVPIDNPVKYYTDLAKEYLDVDVKIMRKVIELLYKNWRDNIHRHAGLEAIKAMNHILELTHEELKEWYTSVTDPGRIKSAERSLKLFAWYCEMGILTYSDKEVKYKRSNGVLGFWKELPKYSIDDSISVKAINVSEIAKLENFLYSEAKPFILSSDPGKTAKLWLENVPQHCDTVLELKAYMLGTGELTITTSDNVYIYRDRINNINITLPSENNSFKIEFIPDDITSSLDIANFVINNRYNDSYELEYNGIISNVNFTIQYVLDFMTIAGDSIEEVQPVFKTTAQLAYTLDKFREYMEIHHNKKHKGKRLTVRKS